LIFVFKTFDEAMSELSPERRAKVERRGSELILEERVLQAVCKQLEVTREGLAERLDLDGLAEDLATSS
jgi:hypothetical protein